MRMAKSIDELYEEVKDYDLVLCNDAPLALALNNRIDRPLIGTFATTPQRIARSLALDILGRSLISDIEVIKKVSDETGYSLRFVHGEIENIKRMLRFKADIVPLLKKRGKRIYESFIQLPTLERVMWEFDVERSDYYKDKEVAVIGIDLFDQLDKKMTPLIFDDIDMFKDETYKIPEIRELNNNRQIAENVSHLIDKDNATDFAIVMDVGGGIADAIRSALYRRRIPFKNTLSVKDLNHVREFLEFLKISLSFDTARISQIRELISSYGGKISAKYDEYLAERFLETGELEDKKTIDIINVMRSISGYSFGDVCDSVVPRNKAPQIKLLLDEMGLTDSAVSLKDTDDLIYAVNNISDLKHNEQIPDSEKEGVVLIDCKNSVYIDRPVVVFIGMGQDWDKDLSFLNQIDYRMKPDENDRDLMKFQILLQQGTRRLYVCNAIRGGKKSKPCSLFGQCSDDSITGFEDVCDGLYHGAWHRPEPPVIMTRGSDVVGKGPLTIPFSKTSYSNYVSCPRLFMYSILTSTPDRSSTVVGNILHEYAEMRICYPEIVKERGKEYYVSEITEICSGLFPPEMRDIEMTSIRNSIENLDRYIEFTGLDIHGIPDSKLERKKPNRFFEEEGKTLGCDFCEDKLRTEDNTMEGIFDVLKDNIIIDFKTGKPLDINQIVQELDYDGTKGYKDFQSLFYLSILDDQDPKEDMEFHLFFTKDNQDKINSGLPYSISDNVRRVVLIPDREYYFRNIFPSTVTAAKYQCLDNIWPTVMDSLLSDDIDSDDYMERLTDMIMTSASVSRSKAKNAADVVKIFRKTKNGSLTDDDTLYVTRDDLTAFRDRLSKDFVEASRMNGTEFPALPKIKCEDCSCKDMCMAQIFTGGEIDV